MTSLTQSGEQKMESLIAEKSWLETCLIILTQIPALIDVTDQGEPVWPSGKAFGW